MKISEIILGGTKKRLHRDPRKRRHVRSDNLYDVNLSDLSETELDEVIRKVGDKFRLYSKKGKNLGTYDSRAGAEKREKQVNYFKHMSEGYQLQLERDPNMYVLHITDTKTGKRTEVRGKPDYETTGYDANDNLHQLLDKLGKSANFAELINGEVVTINPKHPDAEKAKAATDRAFNEGAYDSITFKQKRQQLNVPYLIQKGAIYITDPHGPDGWEPDSEGFSLLTLYNVKGGGWQGEAKQHLKPSEYANAAKMINAPLPASGNNHLVYDGKYNQILWSIKKLGLGKEAFLGNVNEETGVEMLKIFRTMHHDTAKNKEMDAFIKSHEWELRDFTPDMFPSEEDFFDYDDPFDRVIDIDYYHRVDLSQPIIVGPQYSDGKYSVIDGNHRAARAQQLGKTIKGYFPVKATTEGVAREPDPTGYSHTRLTAPANTIVINTPGELDWYKMGEYIANLGNEDPHEFGQSESDMVVTLANREQVEKLKSLLDRLGADYKEIGGSHEHPEIHTENKRGR